MSLHAGRATVLVAVLASVGCYVHHERGREREEDSAVPPAVRLVAIGAGADHTCAIDDGGELWCWGFAQQGQLGHGLGDPARCAVGITEGPVIDRPVRVAMPDGRSVHAVSGGPTHTCAVLDGAHACWGAGCQGQLGDGGTDGSATPRAMPSPATGIWAGAAHTCVATADGSFACTGANDRGQLGQGTTSPLSEPGATSFTGIEGLRSVIDAGLGVAHTCALDAGGAVWCWGANGAGQLGDGTFEVRSRPSLVALPSAASAIAAGDRHTCAVTALGVRCWGWNARGQLGNGVVCADGDDGCGERASPERVLFDGAVDDVDGGAQFSCLRSGGEVWCWGANDVGQLGRGDRVSSAVPVRVVGIVDARAISCGANHACAILADGRTACWGRNAQGQLGDGTREDALSPSLTRFEPR